MTVDELAKKVGLFLENHGAVKAGVIAGAVLGGTELMSAMLSIENESHKHQMLQEAQQKQKKEKRMRSDSQLVKDAYNYQTPFVPTPENQVLNPQNGLVQQLYGERSGHSKSWGGRRY
jgi:heme exporter protein D